MTEPLPTDALRRLEALIKDLTGFNSDGSLSIDSETFMAVYIEYCTRQALLPWVAVPDAIDVVLCQYVTSERRMVFYAGTLGGVPVIAFDVEDATRFPDPLTALEKLRTDSDPTHNTCPTCNGLGEIRGFTCTDCRGTGEHP